jgi:hypothetical protein
MIITQPITMLTDYAIALESVGFAIALLWMRPVAHPFAVRLWAIAFVATAVAAAVGGTCHGFLLYLANTTGLVLWKTVMVALSLASSLMLWATVVSAVGRRLHPWWLGAIGLKLALYLGWIAIDTSFTAVVVDYLSAMLLVLLLQLVVYRRGTKSEAKKPDFYSDPELLLTHSPKTQALGLDHQGLSAIWVIAGVIVSGIAASVLSIQFTLANGFSTNDLYHLIQMVALYLFYRGVCVLSEKGRSLST